MKNNGRSLLETIFFATYDFHRGDDGNHASAAGMATALLTLALMLFGIALLLILEKVFQVDLVFHVNEFIVNTDNGKVSIVITYFLLNSLFFYWFAVQGKLELLIDYYRSNPKKKQNIVQCTLVFYIFCVITFLFSLALYL